MKYFILLEIFLFFIIFRTLCLRKNEEQKDSQLLFVYEHCRHGNRAPNYKKNGLYNKKTKMDIYNVFWDKPGILTESGKLQHFFLGLRNQYKYRNFINFSNYNKNEILLRATGSKRCIESLYYQLLGMYYQKNENNKKSKVELNNEIIKYSMPPNINIWNTKKRFYEIKDAIKTFLKNKKIEGLDLNSFNSKSKKNFNIKTIKKDYIFATQRCKNHEKYIKAQRKIYKQIIKKNFIDVYSKKLKKFIKFENDSFFYKRGISKSLADHFISDYLNGRKELLEFFKKTGINLDDYFEKCKNIYFFFMYNIYCYSKSCILNASRFMNEIINYFDNAINNNIDKRKNNIKKIKMIIDLGHDVTVNSIHVFMKKAFNANFTYCSFACNIYFELYRNSDNYIVKYYDNDSLMLNIEYNKFKKIVQKYLWSDSEIDKFCKGERNDIFKIHKEQDLNDNKRNKKKIFKKIITDL